MEKNNLINNNNLKTNKGIITKKEKLSGIIFTRACCSIGIVIFHYFCSSKGNFRFLFSTANSSYGFIFVTSFFCISGTVLYYNYPKIKSLKNFYFKRWKSIFPSYYICFLYFFLMNSFRLHKLFYNGHWSKLFLTLAGLDGYLFYRIKTYYLVGAWFIGAIIIIYILYPLLLLMTKNNIIINNIIIAFFYILMYKTNFFIISKERNIITCITSFYLGMEAIRFKNIFFNNKISFIIFLFIFLTLRIIKVSPFILIFQIQGFSLFIILNQIGKYVMKSKLKIIFSEISKLSYNIFLFHHKIIHDVLGLINPIEFYFHILLLLITFTLTFISSKIHFEVVNYIIQSFIFKKIESIFI